MGKTFSTGLLTNGIWQDASNNIGIGGSPSGSYKLEVTGTAKVSSTLLVSGTLTGSAVATFTAAANPLILKSTSATTGYTEYYYNTSTLAGIIGNGGGILTGANNSDFIVRSEADFVVATGGNNRRLTIASTGAATFSSNIAIAGQTLSAWGGTFGVMQSYYGSYFGGTSGGGTVMGNNNYYDGTNYKYINSDFAGQIQIGGGNILLRVAASGSAAGTVTFTNALTIASTGAATFAAATGGAITLTTNGSANNWTSAITGSSTTSQSYGLLIQAGTNSTDAALRIRNQANTLDWLFVRGDGNIGMGTTNPSYALSVVKSTNDWIGQYKNYGSVAYGLQIDLSGSTGATSGYALGVYTQTGTGFFVKNDGNVGIGTTTPDNLLVVSGGTGSMRLEATSTNRSAFVVQNTGNALYMGIDNSSGTYFGSSAYAINFQGSGNYPMLFWTNSLERMRITSGGNTLIGTTTDNGYRVAIRMNTTSDTGGAMLIQNSADAISHYIFTATNSVMNTQDASIWMRKNGATGRSINAAGTINASGNDYAEYMLKAITDNIEKGDIVGVDSNGKLTNIFANSISFVVKSTDPSYVGGDTWFNIEPLLESNFDTKEDYDIAYSEYKLQLEDARQKVDRIAFSGQVPCNVYDANVGDYIIPINDNGKIKGQAITNPTFEQYQLSVGKVWKIMEDGRAWIAVKIG